MIDKALMSLRPGAQFILINDEIHWHDTKQTQPTDVEIATEIARLQQEYEDKEYQRDRAKEYPSIADQLDTLYHGGLDAWKAQIKTVKDKYPKA